VGSLISINVGLPKDVEWQGRIVHTAVWKQSIPGRVMARRLNLDGDGQGDLAGHGGEHRAVMVYQLGSYRYWETYLQRHDFSYGQFGENLTVEGLADDEVCIGDRYRIGGALFEVTQPRVTCYRVGIRMNDPRMPSLLVSHRRPGFYFRVIEEGEIGAGDNIVKVVSGPEQITVAQIDALLYLPGHPHDQLTRALKIPSLSSGWRGSLKSLLDADEHGGNAGLAPTTAPPAAWTGFRPLRVTGIQRESVDVLSFTLASEDQTPLPAPVAGQFLVFKLEPEGSSTPLLRSYSISGSQMGGTYRVSVKREGSASSFLHEHIHIGDLLQVSAPRGAFTLTKSKDPVVLLGAGIGATPLLAMLHALSDDRESGPAEIWWCYGARNGREHPFAIESQKLLADLGQSHSLIVYSMPREGDEQGKDYDVAGHLNASLLEQHHIPLTAEFYLCGPPAFLEELTAGLVAKGISGSRIHAEVFGAGAAITPGIAANSARPPHAPDTTGTGPSISFTRSGLTVPWDDRFPNLLEFAEACDIPVRWSCRVGVCHMCESGMIDGRVAYAPDPLDKPADGNILICCSTPQTELELDL